MASGFYIRQSNPKDPQRRTGWTHPWFAKFRNKHYSDPTAAVDKPPRRCWGPLPISQTPKTPLGTWVNWSAKWNHLVSAQRIVENVCQTQQLMFSQIWGWAIMILGDYEDQMLLQAISNTHIIMVIKHGQAHKQPLSSQLLWQEDMQRVHLNAVINSHLTVQNKTRLCFQHLCLRSDMYGCHFGLPLTLTVVIKHNLNDSINGQ